MRFNIFKSIAEYLKVSTKKLKIVETDTEFILRHQINQNISKDTIDRFIQLSDDSEISEVFFNQIFSFVRRTLYRNDQFCSKIISMTNVSERAKLFSFGHLCMKHKDIALNMLSDTTFTQYIVNNQQDYKMIEFLIRVEQYDVIKELLSNEPIRNNIYNNTSYLTHFNIFVFQQLERGKNYLYLLENEKYNLVSKSAFEKYYHDNYLNLHIAVNLNQEAQDWIKQHKIIFMKDNLEKQLSNDKISYKKIKI